MKSIRCAHIVVVADSDHALLLAARLRRMNVAQITSADGIEEARAICQAGGADACIVSLGDVVPDAIPVVEGDAPGRQYGVPSLMLVPTVTPYLRQAARRCGYLTPMPAAIPARMFYRRVGAALQQRRAACRTPRRLPGYIIGVPFTALPTLTAFGKPTLH
jgi:hypothetical protein